MEIPYIVNPRKDTGLNNSKIAIWLFLASEVMLFGGLFSSYIFLRVFADYPWPERALPILPGFINTFVLIASSVAVVFAWAALKMRKWGMFVGNMTFTLLCAVAFMVLKAGEYSGKFHHHGTQTTDYGWVEGHVAKDHPNAYTVDADKINFSLDSTSKKYLAAILAQSDSGKQLTLASDYKVREIHGDTFDQKVLFAKGTPLAPDVLAEAKKYYIKARTHNQKLRTQLLRDAWLEVRDPLKYPDLVGLQDFDSQVKNAVTDVQTSLVKKAEENNAFLIANGNMVFDANGVQFKLNSGWGRMTDPKQGDQTNVNLLDGTVLSGKAGDSSIFYEYIDALDFRDLVMKAEAKGLDPAHLIEKSPILHFEGKSGDKIRQIWAAHKVWREYLRADLAGPNPEDPARVPTELDLYRVTWHQMVAYHALKQKMVEVGKISVDAPLKDAITEENWTTLKKHAPHPGYDLTGPSKNHKKSFPQNVAIPRDEIRFDSVFSPKMNNYYAIYFTITGLHGLHVIGGAIVLGYYLFFGRKMYLSNPDWLANRVEVAGLFWHFVDLVWILVFPIFYLM